MDDYPKNFVENHLVDKVTGMGDVHARLEKLERQVKILETTLQFFFQPSSIVDDIEADAAINRNYP
jgi:hypothetical protein